MKQLRVLLLPPGWDASPSQGYPSSMSPVPIYTPGWRETMWCKVSWLRKQHDGRHWTSNHRLSDLKSNALTTTPPTCLKEPFHFRLRVQLRCGLSSGGIGWKFFLEFRFPCCYDICFCCKWSEVITLFLILRKTLSLENCFYSNWWQKSIHLASELWYSFEHPLRVYVRKSYWVTWHILRWKISNRQKECCQNLFIYLFIYLFSAPWQ